MRCAWVYKSNSCFLLVSLSFVSHFVLFEFFFSSKIFCDSLHFSSLFVCFARIAVWFIQSISQSQCVTWQMQSMQSARLKTSDAQSIYNEKLSIHCSWLIITYSGYPYVHHTTDTTLCAYRQFAIRPFTVIRMYHTETHTRTNKHTRTLRMNEWMTTACVRIANHQNHTFKWYFALATRLTRSTSFCSFSIYVFWFRFCSKVRIHFNPNTAYTTLHHTLCVPSADARDEGETAKEKKNWFLRSCSRSLECNLRPKISNAINI